MTQEEKDLLLKDICARLPYGVIVQVYFEDIAGSGYFDEKAELIDIDPYCPHVNDRWIENIKPYLRPMSSMTEEEEKQLQKIHQDFIADKKYNSYGCARADDGWVSIEDMDTVINFLNAHHFDYRGLIPKGLALEAPEDMYSTNIN